MGFVNVANLGDDYEDKPVAEGEYDLRITDAKDQRNKEDSCDQTLVMIEIEGEEEDTAMIFHYLTYPGPEDDKPKVRSKMRFITRFLTVFGIKVEGDGYDTEDLIGQTGRCVLEQEEWDGDIRNTLRLPRVEA